MTRNWMIAAALIAIPAMSSTALADAIPRSFSSQGADRKAIQAVLDTYVRAVSTRNEALFETLLLSKDIPFSDVGGAVRGGDARGTRNYEDFRRGVFEGAPFTQRFRDVTVLQDGDLADVSLVFVNTDAEGTSWGWKTIQLLKVAGRWRIASEFYTGHSGERR